MPLSVVVLNPPCGDAYASTRRVFGARAEPLFVLSELLFFEASAVCLPSGAFAADEAAAEGLLALLGARGGRDGGDGGDSSGGGGGRGG